VFAPQAKKSVQIRPIYRGNALSGSFRSMNAEVTRAHTPPIAYRTHCNTLQRLQVDTGLSLVQIHAQTSHIILRPDLQRLKDEGMPLLSELNAESDVILRCFRTGGVTHAGDRQVLFRFSNYLIDVHKNARTT
jgi:hypothetical protein